MASTYTLISSNVLSSSAASVTFSSIPATYTDLVLLVSGRFDISNNGGRLRFNGDSSALYSWTRIVGTGAAAESNNNATYGSPYDTFIYFSPINTSTQTSNTFSTNEMYIPNYTISQNRQVSLIGANENNSSSAFIVAEAGLYRSTTAISSIALTSDGGGNWVSGSSFYLYGISNA